MHSFGGLVFRLFYISEKDYVAELNQCLEKLSRFEVTRSLYYENIKLANNRYDLKDVLLLPSNMYERDVIVEHAKRWNIDSDLYIKCGITISKSSQPFLEINVDAI